MQVEELYPEKLTCKHIEKMSQQSAARTLSILSWHQGLNAAWTRHCSVVCATGGSLRLSTDSQQVSRPLSFPLVRESEEMEARTAEMYQRKGSGGLFAQTLYSKNTFRLLPFLSAEMCQHLSVSHQEWKWFQVISLPSISSCTFFVTLEVSLVFF